MSQVFKQLWQIMGVKPFHATIYHLQTNGLVEHFNGTLKQMNRMFVREKSMELASADLLPPLHSKKGSPDLPMVLSL